MKRLFSILPLILALGGNVSGKTVDRILAQVNDEMITQSDLNRRVAGMRRELSGQYTGDQLEAEIKKAEKGAMDRMIEEKLLLQRATELGFKTDVDLQVSAYLEQLRKQFNFKDQEELEKAISQQGMTLQEFREQTKQQMIINSLVSEMVSSRISVLSQEIEKYYKDHIKDYTTPEEVTLSEIVIPFQGNVSEAEARAADIHSRLRKGESFAALASQYSKGPTAGKGGSIGSYMTSSLTADVANAVANVNVEDISPVQKGKDSFVIYRVDVRKVAAARPLDEVKDEIRKLLWEQKFNPEYNQFIALLKENAYIQIFSESK
jgi:peptidyl-prolyl cis-trans isomerase SurA